MISKVKSLAQDPTHKCWHQLLTRVVRRIVPSEQHHQQMLAQGISFTAPALPTNYVSNMHFSDPNIIIQQRFPSFQTSIHLSSLHSLHHSHPSNHDGRHYENTHQFPKFTLHQAVAIEDRYTYLL